MSERVEKEPTPKPFTLRQATQDDLLFLFHVSTEAMKPVSELSGASQKSDEERLAEYKKKFVPEATQIIQHDGKDIGRLRVVRSPNSLYVGGVQILPEHQGKGVGTALFTELIKESNQTHIPILLEVHDVNIRAIAFYKSLGFEEGEKIEGQTVMRYLPK